MSDRACFFVEGADGVREWLGSAHIAGDPETLRIFRPALLAAATANDFRAAVATLLRDRADLTRWGGATGAWVTVPPAPRPRTDAETDWRYVFRGGLVAVNPRDGAEGGDHG